MKIKDTILSVRNGLPSSAIILAHEKTLQHGTTKYSIYRMLLKTLSVPMVNPMFSQDNHINTLGEANVQVPSVTNCKTFDKFTILYRLLSIIFETLYTH